jgi:hypothetical protein
VLTDVQYQTSYLLNIPPHSSKQEGVRVKTNGGDFGIYEGGNSQRLREDVLQLDSNTTPFILPKATPSMETLHLALNAWRQELRSIKILGKGKAIPVTGRGGP